MTEGIGTLELPSSIERPIPLLRKNSLDTRDLGAVGGEEHACMDDIRLLIARARQLRESRILRRVDETATKINRDCLGENAFC